MFSLVTLGCPARVREVGELARTEQLVLEKKMDEDCEGGDGQGGGKLPEHVELLVSKKGWKHNLLDIKDAVFTAVD